MLRGRSSTHQKSWTRVAQVYPKKLAFDLDFALAAACGLTDKKIKLNIGGCAHCAEGRIGEAKNPGPRRAVRQPRDVNWLAAVELVEPVTRALQVKVWRDFESWLSLKLSAGTLAELALCSLLYADLLQSYGIHLFSRGHALYEFRHLLVVAQHSFPDSGPF